jgi:hypothetical protein
MSEEKRTVSPLAEAELEVLEKGQEWMRRRLEKKLQRLAEGQGAVSPPEPPAAEGCKAATDSDSNDGR